ncbi:MAG: hypothetical protein O2973_06110 [Gemmatimonadetes bacterium]|nr:hypothetical protein [Gemmatimonadota bacterium]
MTDPSSPDSVIPPARAPYVEPQLLVFGSLAAVTANGANDAKADGGKGAPSTRRSAF